MRISVHPDKTELGRAAAREGAAAIQEAIGWRGRAVIIVATGASQFEMLDALVQEPLDWSKVTVFHLDEYVGLPSAHPASFRRYIQERFVSRLPALAEFIPVLGDASDCAVEVARLNTRIAREQVDVCFAGIGENCHLAFNDPPADFDTDAAYLVVKLDEACRAQQMGEGWFPELADVPETAISMSVRQIMKSAMLVLAVPDRRKAQAVSDAVEGPITNLHPASIVQAHANCSLHLDKSSASLLKSVRA